MPNEPRIGRTPADLAAELLKFRLLIPILLVMVPSFWLAVYLTAEPGSEISFVWGLVKYQKVKEQSIAPLATADSLDSYKLPEEIIFYQDNVSYPILDQALNVSMGTNGDIRFGGVNIGSIRIAARYWNGESMKLIKIRNDGMLSTEKRADTYIEIEYKGNFFSINIGWPYYGRATAKINSIRSPSLDLNAYTEL